MKAATASPLILTLCFASCTAFINVDADFEEQGPDAASGSGGEGGAATSGGTSGAPSSAGAKSSAGAGGSEGGSERGAFCGEVDRVRPCSEAQLLGACADGFQTCGDDGEWSACSIEPADADTCETGNDADCDGVPNEGCGCVTGTERPCRDALGNCALGTQVCDDGEWGECSIQPGQDSCDVPGDDADCDGTPNSGCSCSNGDTQPCGPDSEEGICRRGESTCESNAWGPCVGAVHPGARDCRSSEDSDCDGMPDNTLDDTCECTVDDTEPCNEHPGLDGSGICRAGTRTCIASASNVSSAWGSCVGAVGPSSRNCASAEDNDCDGEPDDTVDSVCKCAGGSQQGCREARACQTGVQHCELAADRSSSNWGECVYENLDDGTECGGGDCDPACDAGFVCDQDECIDSGGGDAVGAGECLDGACMAVCGGEGEDCCNFACDSGLACAGMPGTCVDDGCGSNGQACCGGTTCDAGLLCEEMGCVPCGAQGQACCENMECDGGLACVEDPGMFGGMGTSGPVCLSE